MFWQDDVDTEIDNQNLDEAMEEDGTFSGETSVAMCTEHSFYKLNSTSIVFLHLLFFTYNHSFITMCVASINLNKCGYAHHMWLVCVM